MKNELKTLAAYLEKYGVTVDNSLFDGLLRFTDLLLDRAEKVNLTAIKDPHGVMIKHYLDSLIPLSLFDFPQNAGVIDVGCGAGFPSTPLGLARRDLRITQLDSLKKRVTFLEDVSRELSLGFNAIHARAEDAARTGLRDSFDIAVSRAVAPLPVLCEYCLPFVKPGGVMLAYKGAAEEDAAAAIKALSAKTEDVISYELPENAGERRLVVIRKLAPTHPIYPRSSKNMSKGAIK